MSFKEAVPFKNYMTVCILILHPYMLYIFLFESNFLQWYKMSFLPLRNLLTYTYDRANSSVGNFYRIIIKRELLLTFNCYFKRTNILEKKADYR